MFFFSFSLSSIESNSNYICLEYRLVLPIFVSIIGTNFNKKIKIMNYVNLKMGFCTHAFYLLIYRFRIIYKYLEPDVWDHKFLKLVQIKFLPYTVSCYQTNFCVGNKAIQLVLEHSIPQIYRYKPISFPIQTQFSYAQDSDISDESNVYCQWFQRRIDSDIPYL